MSLYGRTILGLPRKIGSVKTSPDREVGAFFCLCHTTIMPLNSRGKIGNVNTSPDSNVVGQTIMLLAYSGKMNNGKLSLGRLVGVFLQ